MVRENIALGWIGMLLMALLGCSEASRTGPEDVVFKFPTVVDTFHIERQENAEKWLSYSHYIPYYIGPRKDSILLPAETDLERYAIEAERYAYAFPDSDGILIRVDTSVIVSKVVRYWSMETHVQGMEAYMAYPVYVVNVSQDTLGIYSRDQLLLCMEAVDQQGRWQKIEEHFPGCGMGSRELMLPPDEMVLTTAPVFRGDFRTRLRLRYRNIFSNEFWGKINLTQFESEWEEDGELRIENWPSSPLRASGTSGPVLRDERRIGSSEDG